MSIINGKSLGVYLNGTLISFSKSCKLSVTHEPRDTTNKDTNGWKTAAEGNRSWKIDCEGLVDFSATNGVSALFTLMTNRTLVGLSFETSVSGEKRWYGNGYITNIDMDAPNQESATFSVSFEGTDTLTEVAHT